MIFEILAPKYVQSYLYSLQNFVSGYTVFRFSAENLYIYYYLIRTSCTSLLVPSETISCSYRVYIAFHFLSKVHCTVEIFVLRWGYELLWLFNCLTYTSCNLTVCFPYSKGLDSYMGKLQGRLFDDAYNLFHHSPRGFVPVSKMQIIYIISSEFLDAIELQNKYNDVFVVHCRSPLHE